MSINEPSWFLYRGAGIRWHSGENACLPPMCPGFNSRTQRHMWVFPSPKKPTFQNSNSIWNCQALYHEPLARMIAQALPVFDIKFAYIFLWFVIVSLVFSYLCKILFSGSFHLMVILSMVKITQNSVTVLLLVQTLGASSFIIKFIPIMHVSLAFERVDP